MGGFIEFNEISIRIYDQDTIRGLFECCPIELLFLIKLIIFFFFYDELFFNFIRILHYKILYFINLTRNVTFEIT